MSERSPTQSNFLLTYEYDVLDTGDSVRWLSKKSRFHLWDYRVFIGLKSRFRTKSNPLLVWGPLNLQVFKGELIHSNGLPLHNSPLNSETKSSRPFLTHLSQESQWKPENDTYSHAESWCKDTRAIRLRKIPMIIIWHSWLWWYCEPMECLRRVIQSRLAASWLTCYSYVGVLYSPSDFIRNIGITTGVDSFGQVDNECENTFGSMVQSCVNVI